MSAMRSAHAAPMPRPAPVTMPTVMRRSLLGTVDPDVLGVTSVDEPASDTERSPDRPDERRRRSRCERRPPPLRHRSG